VVVRSDQEPVVVSLEIVPIEQPEGISAEGRAVTLTPLIAARPAGPGRAA
jgi:hypothetical protein